MLRTLLVVAVLNLGSTLVLNENSGSPVQAASKASHAQEALTKGNTTQGEERAETEAQEVSDTGTEQEGAEMLLRRDGSARGRGGRGLVASVR